MRHETCNTELWVGKDGRLMLHDIYKAPSNREDSQCASKMEHLIMTDSDNCSNQNLGV